MRPATKRVLDRRIAILALLIIAAALASVIVAFPARAVVRYSTWSYSVDWYGWPTLLVTEFAGPYSYLTLARDGAVTGSGRAPSGVALGVDPHVQESDAAWVSCKLFINDVLVDSDYAAYGDGTEVICMGVAP
jgi:hypothetical protein